MMPIAYPISACCNDTRYALATAAATINGKDETMVRPYCIGTMVSDCAGAAVRV